MKGGMPLPMEETDCVELDAMLVVHTAEYWMPVRHVEKQIPEKVQADSRKNWGRYVLRWFILMV